MSVVVPGRGPTPCRQMIVGEAPGYEEAQKGKPFVGKSGREQDEYLRRVGMHSSQFYVTNVVKEFIEGNPDPTPTQLKEWTPVLESEVEEVGPLVIFAVGRFAARWFLGESAEMETIHGIPHEAGAFDPSRCTRGCGAIIIPIYHPALGFYDNDARAVIAWDYAQAAGVVKRISSNREVVIRSDPYEGREDYLDVNGPALESILNRLSHVELIGLDTEGSTREPWSVQVSMLDGTGYCLRFGTEGFDAGISAIQRLADRGTTIAVHNAMYDLEMCRVMGLDLYHPRVQLFDTMYAAYLLRLEPQGLKQLVWRWCGMRMSSYEDTLGDVGVEKQLSYLGRALDHTWEKPEPRLVFENDGTSRIYKPQSVEKRIEKIILDVCSGKTNKDDEVSDPFKRWRAVDEDLRSQVEQVLGPMPIATLDDIPLDRAIHYSCRDADATRRLTAALRDALEDLDLTSLMSEGMEVVPMFSEMQANGFPCSRSHFEKLSEQMTEEMEAIQTRISNRYFGRRPFNPGSSKHVATLMRRRGLQGAKRTSTGEMSTGKQSIEHLRFSDDAISDVFEWRERQHIRDSFCQPVLDRVPPDRDQYTIRCRLKVTRTATRRLASTDPNLLAIPIRKDLGRRIRDGYRFPSEGTEVFGAWDLSQIEMRVAAHESRDKLLCKLFHEDRDIHGEVAALIFGLPLDEVMSKEGKMKYRLPAKNAGFGILYGIGGGGLLTQLRMQGQMQWDEQSCEKLIREWLKVYRGVADYIRATQEEVAGTGVVRDRWGMIRYIPGITSTDPKVAAEAGRIAVSHRIQGGAQGMIQKSMSWLRPHIREMQDAGMRVRPRLQIHDEIILSFDEEWWDLMDGLVIEALTEHCGVTLRVPVKAEGHMSKSWGELK